jgi:Zn finger protein HypA/HybF involved in hydrogenase expression
MSSNYPEGSMRGSGIYSEDYEGTFSCSECEKDYELEGQTNDWGTMAYAICPDCNSELEIEIDTEYDEQANQADRYWKDR